MRKVRFRDNAGQTRTGEWTDEGIETADKVYRSDDVTLLPPTEPTKIVCQAGGYMDHREESGFEELPERPELFLKTPNCLTAHGEAIELPPGRDLVEFEAEFGIVISNQCRGVTETEAMDYVAGYTCVNDISNRDDQEQERNWVRGKAFDGSIPMGPVIATPDEVPADAALTLRHNGEVKQETTREHMIFNVPELVAEVAELITLEPGDVIATGTPFGPDALESGDTVEVEFDGVGTLTNYVTER